MRAERLLQVVALLRQHGRLSAAELGRRLEVTPRTVMRDLDLLSANGVPVYAEQGRNGGYSLLPGWRPDAESLTPQEARALFVAGGAGVADALGLGDAFSQALRRLSTNLTADQATQVGHTLERVVVDPSGWGGAVARHPEALETVFRAVQEDRQLHAVYRARSSGRDTDSVLNPWGLVLAGATWYLVAARDRTPHTYKLSRFVQVETLPSPAVRPANFDLLRTWRELRAAWNARPTVAVRVRVMRDQSELAMRSLQPVLTGPARQTSAGDWVELEADVTSLRGVVGVLLGYGAWAEALDPPELRELMVTVADEARAVHQGPAEG